MNFMLRMNLNIAIVSMVRHTTKLDYYELKNESYEHHGSPNASSSLLTNTNTDQVRIIFEIVYYLLASRFYPGLYIIWKVVIIR